MKSMANIYVYDGEGAGEKSKHRLMSSLKEHVCPKTYHVSFITPEEIKTEKWVTNTSLLAIGGGYDLGFINALGVDGTKTILDYVHGGGRYLGLCAGGYFGCDFIEFDKGGPMEVCGARQLKFYRGKCVGPVFPGFQYNKETGASAPCINVRLPDQEPTLMPIYFNGGGAFYPYSHHDTEKPRDSDIISGISQESSSSDQPSHQEEVLATFHNAGGSAAAIVKVFPGRGKAILTGIHPEFRPTDLDQNDDTVKKFIMQLYDGNDLRNQCFRKILNHLDISIKEFVKSPL